MFDGFARFRDFRRHGPALSLNNNNSGNSGARRLPTRAGSPQRLACCGRQNRETNRLECHRKLESAGELVAG